MIFSSPGSFNYRSARSLNLDRDRQRTMFLSSDNTCSCDEGNVEKKVFYRTPFQRVHSIISKHAITRGYTRGLPASDSRSLACILSRFSSTTKVFSFGCKDKSR